MDKKRKWILLTITGVFGVILFNAPILEDLLSLVENPANQYLSIFILWGVFIVAVFSITQSSKESNRSEFYDE